ncbi:hypothetical protein [Streptomyces sp. NPDC003952]
MLHRPTTRRGGLLLAGGTALVLALTLPASPATAAVGDVQVALSTPGDGGRLVGAPVKLITSPQDGRCYTLAEVFPEAPEGSSFGSVSNHSSSAVFLYAAENCGGPPYSATPLGPGEGVHGAALHSFKIKPGASLETPPAAPPAAPPAS